MSDRQAIRRRMRQQRRSLTDRERLSHAEALTYQVMHSPRFMSARHLAVYLAADGEIDPAPLVQSARAMGKQVYLPVLLPVGVNRLWFAPYHADTRLVPNRYGILEPENAARTRVHPLRLDVVFTPLVAFDATGNRLGMGGGYYDRSFHYLLRHRVWRRPHLIGLAYSFQQVEALASEPWDVPLSGIATEQTLIRFRD